eukprot:CAMPEP_0181343000 /NCGR_PEP_ID=MMETSP1101-20121128/31336_1 /TAXON_ID=46948 /ORGANISM="Rhodomonas abbreviata, Strain Caron Lab Isolate" /LENGTH=200 /DNA_ID=CAMNT_0023454567 /DNA_START=151 /DNA_END=750 /DNA_ORIENTATION=-
MAARMLRWPRSVVLEHTCDYMAIVFADRSLTSSVVQTQTCFRPLQELHVTRELLLGHTDSVNCLEEVQDSHLVLSGSDDGTARLWDLRTLQNVLSLSARNSAGEALSPVNSVVAPRQRPHQLFAAISSSVLVFDLRKPAEGDVLSMLRREEADEVLPCIGGGDIEQLAVNPSGTHIAAVDDTGALSLLNIDKRLWTRAAG